MGKLVFTVGHTGAYISSAIALIGIFHPSLTQCVNSNLWPLNYSLDILPDRTSKKYFRLFCSSVRTPSFSILIYGWNLIAQRLSFSLCMQFLYMEG